MEKNDKEEFDNAILYFQKIISNNSINYSPLKMGATFIGIKTNISGQFKLHIYILLFPFVKTDIIIPYSFNLQHIFLKDISFSVGESFYVWLYEEMKKQNSIVVLSLDSQKLTVLPSCFGDTIINIDINCEQKKDWMSLTYKEWIGNQNFKNVFTIKMVSPFLYLVPFPVKPIIFKTFNNLNNYLQIL